MTTTITARDKALLSVVGVLGILVIFFMLVILPLERANEELDLQLAKNEAKFDEIEWKLSRLVIVQADNEERTARLAEILTPAYDMMKSQEIDRLLTGKVIRSGVSAKELNIRKPEDPADVPVFLEPDNTGSNPALDPDGIYLAKVTMLVQGQMEHLDQLLDDLVNDTPGVWITSLNWKSANQEETNEWQLTMELQVGMSMLK